MLCRLRRARALAGRGFDLTDSSSSVVMNCADRKSVV